MNTVADFRRTELTHNNLPIARVMNRTLKPLLIDIERGWLPTTRLEIPYGRGEPYAFYLTVQSAPLSPDAPTRRFKPPSLLRECVDVTDKDYNRLNFWLSTLNKYLWLAGGVHSLGVIAHPAGTYGVQWRLSLPAADLILELHAPAA